MDYDTLCFYPYITVLMAGLYSRVVRVVCTLWFKRDHGTALPPQRQLSVVTIPYNSARRHIAIITQILHG